jgi:hypothetical protein
MVSAWILPENLRYQIIRDRHESGVDLPYVPEAAPFVVTITNKVESQDQFGVTGFPFEFDQACDTKSATAAVL